MPRRQGNPRMPDTSFESSPFASYLVRPTHAPAVSNLAQQRHNLHVRPRSATGTVRIDEPAGAPFAGRGGKAVYSLPLKTPAAERENSANRTRRNPSSPTSYLDSGVGSDHAVPFPSTLRSRNSSESPAQRQCIWPASANTSPTSSLFSTDLNNPGDPWQPPKRWVRGAKVNIKGVGPDWESSDDEREPPWRARMRELDETRLKLRKERKELEAELKRLKAVTRSIDTKVPYSIRKAYHQKSERDDKRAAEARKQGILWTPVVLTIEERMHTVDYERYILKGGCRVPQYEELLKKYYS